MPDTLFFSVLNTNAGPTAVSVLLCTVASLLLGMLIALLYMYRNTCTKSFAVTLALLPAIMQMVILLVNGSLGTGVAVMGAFSLVRFRSAPGTAREICSIFLAMAAGLACGMGYLVAAAVFVVVVGGLGCLYTVSRFGEPKRTARVLKVTIPESLDYTGAFDDLFQTYTVKCELFQVRTTNMGSLFRLEYQLILKDAAKEKEFLDQLRCRNGNLEISCGRGAGVREEL